MVLSSAVGDPAASPRRATLACKLIRGFPAPPRFKPGSAAPRSQKQLTSRPRRACRPGFALSPRSGQGKTPTMQGRGRRTRPGARCHRAPAPCPPRRAPARPRAARRGHTTASTRSRTPRCAQQVLAPAAPPTPGPPTTTHPPTQRGAGRLPGAACHALQHAQGGCDAARAHRGGPPGACRPRNWPRRRVAGSPCAAGMCWNGPDPAALVPCPALTPLPLPAPGADGDRHAPHRVGAGPRTVPVPPAL